jgi:5-methylcytosine-specific restriction endonuclease McrA
MSREKIEATPRKAFTPKQRAEAFLRAAGRCEKCLTKLHGCWELDHIVSLWMGGGHEPSNWQCLCVDCHRREKTPADAKARAKVKRLERKADPVTRKPSRMQSRGFDKSLRRKMNGTIERKKP